MIPNETVDLIRERVDIVEVIGECVELRRAGANYKGLCPFHQEKTPSFNVNQARQMFHCFGCGVGGDVFDFVMNYEGRTFTDAVQSLGARVGVEVEDVKDTPRAKSARDKQRAETEHLLSIMEAAAAFYREQLKGPSGSKAREYLDDRGVKGDVVDAFGLGYAPAEWDALGSRLGKIGATPAEAERVGLLAPRKSGGGHYDRFRDRVIFPVHDAAGRVVALGGRVLPGAPKDAPKYVNSPESPIFSKSRTLYGLSRAREAIRRRETPIIVEGNVDVISMHAHGFGATVAPMGTALTADQVALLRRFAGVDATVVLLFDGDDAGRHAAERSHAALAEAGLGAKVAMLPPTEDPDSYLRRHGAKRLREIIDEAEGLVEHLIKEAAQRAGTDAHEKARGIRSLGSVLSAVTDPIAQDLYRRKIAQAFGVAEELVFRHLDEASGKRAKGEPVAARPTARLKTEGAIASALWEHPVLFEDALHRGVLNLVQDKTLRWILEKTGEVSTGSIDVHQVIEGAPDARVARKLRARLFEPRFEDVERARQEVYEGLAKLRELTEKERAARLQQEISKAEQEGDEDRATRLAQEKLQRKRAEVDLGDASGR